MRVECGNAGPARVFASPGSTGKAASGFYTIRNPPGAVWSLIIQLCAVTGLGSFWAGWGLTVFLTLTKFTRVRCVFHAWRTPTAWPRRKRRHHWSLLLIKTLLGCPPAKPAVRAASISCPFQKRTRGAAPFQYARFFPSKIGFVVLRADLERASWPAPARLMRAMARAARTSCMMIAFLNVHSSLALLPNQFCSERASPAVRRAVREPLFLWLRKKLLLMPNAIRHVSPS